MNDITEKKLWRMNGFIVAIFEFALFALTIWSFVTQSDRIKSSVPNFLVCANLVIFFLASLALGGFFIVQPNESKVFTFFGRYIGTVREAGFSWTNPLVKRKTISLKANNFGTQTLKVNDAQGNPIEIGAIIVWRVTDSAKAVFNVENYDSFVNVQSETSLRVLAGRFPYDSGAEGEVKASLRANQDEVARELKEELHARLQVAGVTIDDARLSHLAYAPEIAQAMLRRQQASAVIAARRLIVDGAVGMVKMALEDLESQGVVKLDNERRASMVNNLLVALVSENEAQPVINTGTLYA